MSIEAVAETISSLGSPETLSEQQYASLDGVSEFFQADGWELGPGLYNSDKWMIAFSGVDSDVRKKWLGSLPDIPGWELYLDLPPKDWEIYFEFPGIDSMICVNGREWSYDVTEKIGSHIVLDISPQMNLPIKYDELRFVAETLVIGEIGELNFNEIVSEINIKNSGSCSNELGELAGFISFRQQFTYYRDILRKKKNGIVSRS